MRTSRLATGAGALASVMLAAALLRLSPWARVFRPDRLLFTENDAYYHMLRVQQTIADYPRAPWFDPWMAYPEGAAIPWPPLFDQLVASAAMVLGWGTPSRELAELVGVFFPVALGVLTVPIAAGLAHVLLGGSSRLSAAAFLALLPAHVEFSSLGRLDQHVAEVFLFDGILLAFVAGWDPDLRARRAWGADVLIGVGITVAFWTWPGSVLYLAFLLAFASLWHVVAPPADRAAERVTASVARGSATALVLLATSVALFAPAGTLGRVHLVGLTGFHVVAVGVTAVCAALVWAFRRRAGSATLAGRALEVTIAVALAAAPALALVPGFLGGARHAMTVLARASHWYRNIREFDPLLFAGFEPVGSEILKALDLFGFGLLLMPVAALHVAGRWRLQPGRSRSGAFLLLWGGLFLALTLARQRFAIYLATPLALYLALVCRLATDGLARRLPAAWCRRAVVAPLVLAAVVAPTARWYLTRLADPPGAEATGLVRALDWLRQQEPSAPAVRSVLAEWDYGHKIEYVAQKPVVVNPFGAEVGIGAMEDAATFFLTADAPAAEALLRRRRVGYVLLANPVTEAHFARGLAPPGTPPVVRVTRRWLSPPHVELDPAFWGLVVSRLYFFDGLVPPGYDGEALGAYRLVFESETDHRWAGLTTKQFKVFEVVAGAQAVVAARPGARVTARTRLTTNQGRAVDWFSTVVADGTGRGSLRLPYATGPNGLVTASPYTLATDNRRVRLSLTPDQAAAGGRLEIDLDREAIGGAAPERGGDPSGGER